MAIYVNLNVVMAQRRISSQELAAQVGVSRQAVSKWEHSLQHPGRHL